MEKWTEEAAGEAVERLDCLLSTNTTQGLPAEPGGRAERASMISFSYKPAPKLVAMGNAYCRTWIFGTCQNFFTILQLPLVPAPTISSRSSHSIDICRCRVWNCVEKPNQGNRAVLVENGQKERRGEQTISLWGGESCFKQIHLTKAGSKRNETKCRWRVLGEWEMCSVAHCNTECVDSPCLPAGPRAFQAGAGIRSTAAAMLLWQAMINASFVSVCGKLPGAQWIPALGEPRTGKKIWAVK